MMQELIDKCFKSDPNVIEIAVEDNSSEVNDDSQKIQTDAAAEEG